MPLLALGLPGDVVTAVLMGGLMIQGLAPGPLLFQDHPEVVVGLFTRITSYNVCYTKLLRGCASAVIHWTPMLAGARAAASFSA